MEKKNETLFNVFKDYAGFVDGWNVESRDIGNGGMQFKFSCNTAMGLPYEFVLYDSDFNSAERLSHALYSKAETFDLDKHAAMAYLKSKPCDHMCLSTMIAEYRQARDTIYALAVTVSTYFGSLPVLESFAKEEKK